MYCGICRKEIEDDSRFCVYCGSPVSQTNSDEEARIQRAVEEWNTDEQTEELNEVTESAEDSMEEETLIDGVFAEEASGAEFEPEQKSGFSYDFRQEQKNQQQKTQSQNHQESQRQEYRNQNHQESQRQEYQNQNYQESQRQEYQSQYRQPDPGLYRYERAPVFTGLPVRDYDPTMDYNPIGMWGYFLYTILFNIPIVGWICIILFSFGATKNINLRNYARSCFCSYIVIVILLVAFGGPYIGLILNSIF